MSRGVAAVTTGRGRGAASVLALVLALPLVPGSPASERRPTVRDDPDRRPAAVEPGPDSSQLLLRTVIQAYGDARRTLVGELGLPDPTLEERLAPEVAIPGATLERGRKPRPDSAGVDAHPEAVRRAALEEFARAVLRTSAPGLERAWAEGFVAWAVQRVEGRPDGESLREMSTWIHRRGEGLEAEFPEALRGSAVWFAFLEEGFGPTALRTALEELGAEGPVSLALDRALRRGSGTTLPEALREFQLWAVLTGERDDRRHFSFASRLDSPRFVSTVQGLPYLSVLAEPALAPHGMAAIRIRPDAADGGFAVRFEGDPAAARWDADLLLVLHDSGRLHRQTLPLGPEGRGELTIPLGAVTEALLLVRHLDAPDAPARRYSWSVHREPGFPFELAEMDVRSASERGQGAVVAWTTRSEQGLLGFNLLRMREEGGRTVRVNPVWIPAVGDATHAVTYHFLDATAEPGVTYVYRLEGVTTSGLTSLSDPVPAHLPR
jgi:hypothetical protein